MKQTKYRGKVVDCSGCLKNTCRRCKQIDRTEFTPKCKACGKWLGKKTLWRRDWCVKNEVTDADRQPE